MSAGNRKSVGVPEGRAHEAGSRLVGVGAARDLLLDHVSGFRCGDPVFSARLLDVVQPALEGLDAFSFLENAGMQWLVVGFAPQPMSFLAGFTTRGQAIDFLLNEYAGETFDYFAIVKARDLFAAP